MSEYTPTYHDEEDPLAGDVDLFVHPDETRTEEQIDHDEKYAVEDYDDYNDNYWDEYDALHGGETPEEESDAEER